ncbi:MAG: hypothetical protein Unbinned3891contig1000_62 [Prokaryotic dsDNA virus sp.]|nr:MAG: hypothetical protein Unbinned3891contig1000_62 [Prokaryotic dsDNA virus sp.]|tara:strand:- start:57337 stop:58236 length:900 start_codon:yes stop_codon:yes gene_type:complete
MNCCSTKHVFNVRNPLRTDPTRTLTIRRRFIQDLNRRYRKHGVAIHNLIVTLDAFGLSDRKSFTTDFSSLLTNVQAREFEFQTDDAKVRSFNTWLQQQINADLLSVPAGTPEGTPWTATYVESSYRKGQLNAYIASKQVGISTAQGSSRQFLQQSFNQPETLSKVRLLATRSFEQLKGVTAAESSQLNRIFADGIAARSGPAEISRSIQQQLTSINKTRAHTLARTEVIHAHSEGQLDSFERLGVEEVGVQAEWSTAGDDRVCPRCAANEGKVYNMKEARGLIPLHPNCRCTWLPALPE